MANNRSWNDLPEPVQRLVLSHLAIADAYHVALTSRRWLDAFLSDDTLWRRYFVDAFSRGIRATSSVRPPTQSTWRQELYACHMLTPAVRFQTLEPAHTNEVLHVAFAPDALHFSTCSRGASRK